MSPFIFLGIAALLLPKKQTDKADTGAARSGLSIFVAPGGAVDGNALIDTSAQQRNRFRIMPATSGSTVAQTPPFVPTFKPQGFR